MTKSKYTNEEITELIKNLFSNNEVMFIYYCGSRAYGTTQANSDTDITVVIYNMQGITHASKEGLDIFAYGIDNFLQRQSISDELPLYNLIHADDVIAAKDNLIYLNPKHKTKFDEILELDFIKILPLYLEAFLSYYENLIFKERVVVKRSYHIYRMKGILDNLLKTKKYSVKLSKEYLDKIIKYKSTWENTNNENVLNELGEVLKSIRAIKQEHYMSVENEV